MWVLCGTVGQGARLKGGVIACVPVRVPCLHGVTFLLPRTALPPTHLSAAVAVNQHSPQEQDIHLAQLNNAITYASGGVDAGWGLGLSLCTC